MVLLLVGIIVGAGVFGAYYIHTENNPYARMGQVFKYWDFRSNLYMEGWDASLDCWVNNQREGGASNGKIEDSWIEGVITFTRTPKIEQLEATGNQMLEGLEEDQKTDSFDE